MFTRFSIRAIFGNSYAWSQIGMGQHVAIVIDYKRISIYTQLYATTKKEDKKYNPIIITPKMNAW